MESRRVAAVTDASRGIGDQIAHELVQSGLFGHVILGCVDPALGEAAAKRICADQQQATKVDVVCLELDVTDGASREAFVAEVKSRYGRLDALVNNAGIASYWPTPMHSPNRR